MPCPIGLETGGWHTRGNYGKNADLRFVGLVEKQPERIVTAHIHQFVRVGYHSGCAPRQHRLAKSGRQHHRRLNVHVRVNKTRHHHLASAINHHIGCSPVDCAHKGDYAIGNPHISLGHCARFGIYHIPVFQQNAERFVSIVTEAVCHKVFFFSMMNWR